MFLQIKSYDRKIYFVKASEVLEVLRITLKRLREKGLIKAVKKN
jgi:hypothetical protein